jgi:hypothetical protein
MESSDNWIEYYASSGGSSKLRDGKSVLDEYEERYTEVVNLHPSQFAEGRGNGTDLGERLAVDMIEKQIWKETKVTKKVTWTTG